MPFVLSVFKNGTCILHHFAFLVWLPTRFFSTPFSHFQPLKPHFLAAILPFLVMCYMAQKGFVYTIAMDIYAFRPAFSSLLPCVLHQNTLRLAAKHTAFSTKTHCVQHQNAPRLAPKCTSFSSKQPKNWRKWRFLEINIHFAACAGYPLFASKPTFARIVFLWQGGRLVDKKGTHNVKILTKNKTNAHFSNTKMRVLEKNIIILHLMVDPTRGENELISQLHLHNP